MSTSIAIVDDHHLFAQALSELIRKFDGYETLFVAENEQELISYLKRKQIPEILLLDLSMPQMDGFETAQYLQEHFPQMKVVALSMFDRDDQVAKMVKLGVRGYLLKGYRPAELRLVLDHVRGKGFPYSDFLTQKLIRHLNHNYSTPPASLPQLNEREMTFLKLSSSELTYTEIADKMCVATRTVDGYRETLFQKLGVKSRVGMILKALRLKLIEL